MTVADLPTVNAALNATSALLLVTGWWLIRRRRIAAHRRAMLAALACSALFLVSYLVYHSRVGSVRFPGTGGRAPVYLAILASHTLLAAAVPVLAVITLSRALARALRSPPADRALDAADLALRLGDRRGRLLDALPDELG